MEIEGSLLDALIQFGDLGFLGRMYLFYQLRRIG